MPVKVTKVGPGTLNIGEVATQLDISCQITTATVTWSKDKDDDVTTLCGDVAAGAVTYTASLTGTLFQDLAEASGIVAYSWMHKGEAVAFEYVPSTADGKQVTGTLTMDPLDVGGEVSTNATSDFEWECVGEPVLADAAAADQEAAEGMTVDEATADQPAVA